MDRGGRWIKVVLFVLGIAMFAGVASVLLDPGLGTPEEGRRVRHAAGFSLAVPRGWGGTPFAANGEGTDLLRLSPEQTTGRGTTMAVAKRGTAPTIDANATLTTFQSQPAYITTQQRRHAWYWTLRFQRFGEWYEIQINNPIELEMASNPLMPFVESFRLEPGTSRPATTDARSTPAPSPTLPVVP